MKSRLFISIVTVPLLAVVCLSGISAQEIQKARKTPFKAPETSNGAIHISIPVDHLKATPVMKRLDLPASFDWRDYGMVTGIRNQGAYGTCWIHAALADLESKVLIGEGITYDFSELNVIACNNHGTTGYTGGVSEIAINYLSVWASVLESCNPYPGDLPYPACVNPACDFYKTVTEWIILPNDINAIKSAIYTYGPAQAVAHIDDTWLSYTGGGCLTGPNNPPDHHILLVGWDDTICSAGGWIIKNSYGVAWGESGYGYVGYDNFSVEYFVNSFTDHKDFNPDETVHYYDEYGWMDEVGSGDGDDWGLVEITPATSDWLHAVNFWAVSGPASYSLYIYDTFDGTSPSDLLAGPITGTVEYAGLYTIDLPKLVPVMVGDPLYIVMRINTYGYSKPIPIDDTGPMETNKSFISNTGSSYTAVDAGDRGDGDIGIRARISSSVERGDPGLFYDFGVDTIDAYPGEIISQSVALANFGFLGGACSESDTFCLHANDALGWSTWGSPALENWIFLNSGTFIYNDIYIEVPCAVTIGETNLFAIYAYYYEDGVCTPYYVDCEDPNLYNSELYYSSDTVAIRIVENPSPLMVKSNANTNINEGQNPVGVPFNVYNRDSCIPEADFHYAVTSCGHVGDAIYQTGTVEDVPSMDYKTVYAVLDASDAIICDRDTLTMICWNTTATCYDTCVQAVHVTEYTDAFEPDDLPSAFSLVQNHPNPFNPVTEISYELPKSCHVTLEIFDVRGRKVAILVNRYEEAGYRTVSWNGRGEDGSQLASGVYFYRISADDFTDSKKMILLR